ncbi:MAG TPA: hypothetical protein VN285_05610, partial [Candidatus Deferrimicrobium sp.]|nr:hypothetical protein [Candidatus Deferrimicrobium sp.]
VLACRPFESDGSPADTAPPPGTVLPTRARLLVQCAHSLIEVTKLLPQGKRPMDGVSFLNGMRVKPGELFEAKP